MKLRFWSNVTFERLERGVVDELCLFDQVKVIVDSIVGHFRSFSPIEEVVVVDDSAAKIRLKVQINNQPRFEGPRKDQDGSTHNTEGRVVPD